MLAGEEGHVPVGAPGVRHVGRCRDAGHEPERRPGAGGDGVRVAMTARSAVGHGPVAEHAVGPPTGRVVGPGESCVRGRSRVARMARVGGMAEVVRLVDVTEVTRMSAGVTEVAGVLHVSAVVRVGDGELRTCGSGVGLGAVDRGVRHRWRRPARLRIGRNRCGEGATGGRRIPANAGEAGEWESGETGPSRGRDVTGNGGQTWQTWQTWQVRQVRQVTQVRQREQIHVRQLPGQLWRFRRFRRLRPLPVRRPLGRL